MYWRLTNLPSMAISEPLLRLFWANEACFPQNTSLCHWVSVTHSPWPLRYRSLVAMETRARVLLLSNVFTSGSPPKNPVRRTLFFKVFIRCWFNRNIRLTNDGYSGPSTTQRSGYQND